MATNATLKLYYSTPPASHAPTPTKLLKEDRHQEVLAYNLFSRNVLCSQENLLRQFPRPANPKQALAFYLHQVDRLVHDLARVHPSTLSLLYGLTLVLVR